MLMTLEWNSSLKECKEGIFKKAQEGDEKSAKILTQINYNYKIPIIQSQPNTRRQKFVCIKTYFECS